MRKNSECPITQMNKQISDYRQQKHEAWSQYIGFLSKLDVYLQISTERKKDKSSIPLVLLFQEFHGHQSEILKEAHIEDNPIKQGNLGL